uniref:Uncharacterized protein n=1 Tax=Chromera velia CCMP2878 TaxID=1169474 RepID=A0A0G4I4B3_9ALVE|mmetsp:Transcript_26291/g.51631  ORF Transcript_26291/g.51631 Transcript_26291/m.51631 type:complete len:470 (+) Transcript_26291:94-1503(+)|eukprot:Cvel_10881.t1-p1 / transcript=Cvel_10881.t1 / gene=Cvel_10881 / organism=Chromera_velia_CCMP2878 / gene_product=L-seryl-tRNA(Sec) kinase, putative / transcript_product=L-seryl-tRNA(Sec) kinase, putative / location=Cvel_scaffold667:17742-22213(-) / protein_length=469 / sequence_SO=supercontig / SO=protein_coding / is_pseudo=false
MGRQEDEQSAGSGACWSRVVVLLCGLPGSGKSSLGRNVCELLSGKVLLRAIVFDDFGCQNAGEGNGGSTSSFSPTTWKAGRQAALEECERAMWQMKEEIKEKRKSDSFVLLVEDNFYLTSMRKKIFLWAENHSFGFVQLRLCTPLSACVSRNAQREGAERVPQFVISHMAENFEWPASFGTEIVEEKIKRGEEGKVPLPFLDKGGLKVFQGAGRKWEGSPACLTGSLMGTLTPDLQASAFSSFLEFLLSWDSASGNQVDDCAGCSKGSDSSPPALAPPSFIRSTDQSDLGDAETPSTTPTEILEKRLRQIVGGALENLPVPLKSQAARRWTKLKSLHLADFKARLRTLTGLPERPDSFGRKKGEEQLPGETKTEAVYTLPSALSSNPETDLHAEEVTTPKPAQTESVSPSDASNVKLSERQIEAKSKGDSREDAEELAFLIDEVSSNFLSACRHDIREIMMRNSSNTPP